MHDVFCMSVARPPGSYCLMALYFHIRMLLVQIANVARTDMKNILVQRRPSSADADNLPVTWVNVYDPVNSSSISL